MSSKSNILSLKPELHENIIRVGGRIRHAELPFDFKHPIILSGKHMISKLILLDLHLKNLHSGREHILSLSNLSDLSTDIFILALRRFIARRGKPEEILSNNGTNFVGANRDLRQAIQDLNQSKIQTLMSNCGIAWKFNPPVSPWMGGSWESLIKLSKRALKTVTNDKTYHEESLITIPCEIECILNSRPLLPCIDDPNDFEALTPNNFLIKRFDNHSPGIFDTSPHEHRSRWKSVQRAVNLFWERFIREYVPSLQRRQKWLTNHRKFQENDLILIKDDKTNAIEDHIMCVQVFGKIDSPCIANWTLKRTARDSEEAIRENIIDQINRNFYMVVKVIMSSHIFMY